MAKPAEAREHDEGNPQLGGTLEFMRLVWAIDHGLHVTSKRMKSSMGVTGPQRLVLRIAGRFPGISAGGLARILHAHPSTLTGVLRRLVNAGLLKRRADDDDGRRAVLELTPAGKRIDACRTGTVEAAIQGALSASDPKDIEATRRVLARLATGLGVEVEGAEAPRRRPRRGAK